MNNKVIEIISNNFRNKKIETIYLTGINEYLASYYPCKFIIDREVKNTSSEIIEINELILKKPVRLNENAVVIISQENDESINNLKDKIDNLKGKGVSVIILANEKSIHEPDVDGFVLCTDSQVEQTIPSIQLLLTCGLLHQREEIVYPKLYQGMDKNINSLNKVVDETILDYIDSITENITPNHEICIVASGTDVATQSYLKDFFEENDKKVWLTSSGNIVNSLEGKQKRTDYLVIKGFDAMGDLDELTVQTLQKSGRSISVVDVEKMKELEQLDRPFAKVISSVIIYYALKMRNKIRR